MTDARPDEQHLSHSVADTEAVAGRLAGTLRGGDVVALHGDLGAGKTQFVRGLVRGLGGSPRAVSSPTFVLLHVYDLPRAGHATITRVYHLDAYRVHGADDFAAIGFNELLEQDDAIVVVEWPERVAELLPSDRTVHVTIAPEAPDADASADDAGDDDDAATTTRRITLQRPL